MPKGGIRGRLASQRASIDRNTKIIFARRTRQVIWSISTGLLLLFGYLQFRNVSVSAVVGTLDASLVWHVALIIYYSSWIFGTRFDTDIQELAYEQFPHKEKWPLQAFGVVAILAVVAGALCWAEGNIERFAVALVIFMVVDHASWRYLIWYLRPAEIQSEEIYRKNRDFYSLEILRVVIAQIAGNWKWWRLSVGVPLAVLICAFAFADSVKAVILRGIQAQVPSISEADASAIVASWLVLAWVVAVETWHWTIRLKTRISLGYLEELRERYSLRPSPVPPPLEPQK